MNVLGLVQLCTAAQPVGGYGYSFGIEQLAQSGRLKSADQLTVLLKRVLLASVGPADGVASGIAYRAARHGAFEKLPEVCAVMSSERLPASMRLASLQMGQRLWGLLRGWEWAGSVHEQFDDLARHNDLHHAVAFGTLASETTASQLRAIATYLLNIARSIVLAAQRAIPLDEMTGQRVLSDVQPTIAELAAACVDKQAGDIVARVTDDGADSLRQMFP